MHDTSQVKLVPVFCIWRGHFLLGLETAWLDMITFRRNRDNGVGERLIPTNLVCAILTVP